MDIQIIVDSCCDLTPALRNLLRVSVASLKIDVGSIHYVDGERIDTKKLIADMKAYKNAPSTACPSPDEYAALMEKSEESFVVTLSGKLSGSYNAAQLAAEGARPDVIVVDPPRKGCNEATLTAIAEMAPRTVVMVSCNAATAARDTRWLVEHGYKAEEVQPVDLFPRTKHVECVVKLVR